jgi:small-conductance mechanosensitive channel
MTKSKTDETLVKFVGSMSYIALLAFVIIAALNQLGIQTTSFIAVLGAAGLAIIEEVIGQDKRLLKDPKAVVLVSELADSSVNLTLRAWASAEDYWGFYFDIMENVKKQFDAQGISIPFPQRDVHMYEHKD